KQIHGHLRTQFLEHCQRNLQFAVPNWHIRDVLPIFKHSKVGRNDLHPAVTASPEDGVEVFVDGCAQYSATKLLVVRRQISSSASKANPHWTANYEHSAKSFQPRNLQRLNSSHAVFANLTCWGAIAFPLKSIPSAKSTRCRRTMTNASCI